MGTGRQEPWDHAFPPQNRGGCCRSLGRFMHLLCLCPQEQCRPCCHKVLQPVVVHSSGGVWRLGT